MANLYNVPLENGIQLTTSSALLTGVTSSITFTVNVNTLLQASSSIKGILVIDRIDSQGNETPAKTEYISFETVGTNSVSTLVRGLAGTTNQDHSAGAIVEFVPDVVWADAINDVFTTQHNSDGTHKTLSAISLASTTLQNTVIIGASLASVNISNFTLGGGGLASINIINSNLDTFTFQSGFSTVSGATQGSMLTFNAGTITNLLVGGIDKSLSVASTASGLLPTWGSVYLHKLHRQGSNATNYVSGGSVNYLETDVIFQSGAIDCVGMTTAGSVKTITFPRAYTQTPMVWLQFYDATSNHYDVVGNLRSPTTTGFTIINSQGGIGSSSIYLWFALGK